LPARAASNVPGKTRAEVQAEVARARAAGELDVAYSEYPVVAVSSAPGKTRAEVKAELAAARASGQLDFAGSQYLLETNTGN
jgi:hypothetical protein